MIDHPYDTDSITSVLESISCTAQFVEDEETILEGVSIIQRFDDLYEMNQELVSTLKSARALVVALALRFNCGELRRDIDNLVARTTSIVSESERLSKLIQLGK